MTTKTKNRVNITMTNDTKQRLLNYGAKKRLQGGLSGVIEYLAWNLLKDEELDAETSATVQAEKSK